MQSLTDYHFFKYDYMSLVNIQYLFKQWGTKPKLVAF